MNLYAPSGSRKLTGLVITLAALIILTIIYLVADVLWNVSESLFTSVGGFITTMGGGHQAAQSMADRSPNYPNSQPPNIP